MEFYDTKCFEYAYAKYLSFSKMVNGLTNALKMLRQEFNNSKNFEQKLKKNLRFAKQCHIIKRRHTI